jgi:hypothetical protein
MKRLFLFGALILVLSAGMFSYEYILDNNPTRTWGMANWTGDTKVTALTGGTWDDGYYDLALPAANQFYFYGRKVTHLRISTNGYIVPCFGSPSGAGNYPNNEPIPSINAPNPLIAVLWDDWDLQTTGEIWYTVNSALYYVIIEWRSVPHYGYPGTSYDFSTSILGHADETIPNTIIFTYADVDNGVPSVDYGAGATVGVEHYTGAQGEEYSYDTASLQNSNKIMLTPFVPIYDMTDGWGDGIPDPVVWRPSDGIWYLRSNYGSITYSYQWGVKNDIPLPGDYGGNAAIDFLVYRPSSSMWFNYWDVPFGIQWGQAGDIPVPADYDGNGCTDLAVYRQNSGLWFIYYLPGGTSNSAQWGAPGDIPIPADYDGDGKADLTVFRPSNGIWYIQKSTNPAQSYIFAWGAEGDIPMPANFDSSSYSTACVYRPSAGQWFSYDQILGYGYTAATWGAESDVPVPNDWTGNNVTDPTVFRLPEGMWYVYGWATFQWGQLGDKPRCRRSSQIVAPPLFNKAVTDPGGNPIR